VSHVLKLKLDIRDLASLEKAASRLGFVLELRSTYKWWGHSVGDYPLPEGFTAEDLGKCDYVLRLANNSTAYEIGVVRRKDGKPGYELLFDFYGAYGRPLIEAIGQDGGKLKQFYAAEVATKNYQLEGYAVTRKTDKQGRIVLEALK